MFNKIQIFCLLYFLLVTITSKYPCIHDQILQQLQRKQAKIVISQQPDLLIADYQNTQKIYTPIYISFSIHLRTTIVIQDRIGKMMNIIITYIGNLLKVISHPITFPQSNGNKKCFQFSVPIEQQQTLQSDLHLFITGKNQSNQKYLAWAAACAIDSSNRPIFGQVNFNTFYIKSSRTNLGFQNDLQTILHEIIHVLGFSRSLYPFWKNQMRLIQKKPWIYLQTQFTKQNAIKHFNCPHALGVPLEDQGDTGSAGSHLQRVIFYDEIMTASSNPQLSKLTNFTLSVLNSTGWYIVNFDYAQQTNYGKNKLCEFLDYSCNHPKRQYQEFCYQPGAINCNFANNAISSCRIDAFSNNCLYYIPYSNTICTQNQAFPLGTTSQSGYNSLCYTSTIALQGNNFNYKSRCYKTKCKDKKIQILIRQIYYTCQKPGQIITDKNNFKGQLICPSNFQQFCVVDPCQNFCNQNGYCIKGQCMCHPYYYGTSCSLFCDIQTHYTYKQQFCYQACPSTKFVDQKNRKCYDQCPKNSYIKQKNCIECASNCNECHSQICQKCQIGYQISKKGTQCIKLNKDSINDNQQNFKLVTAFFIILIIIFIFCMLKQRKDQSQD